MSYALARANRDIKHYPKRLRLLHWTVAALMLPMLIMGFCFGLVSEETGYIMGQWHVTLGILLLPAAIAQLIAYSYLPRPNMLDYMSYDNYWFAKLAHFFLHYAAIAMPVCGMLMCAPELHLIGGIKLPLPFELGKSIRQTLFEVHGTLATITAFVVGAHILGALKQHFWNKTPTLKGMLSDQE